MSVCNKEKNPELEKLRLEQGGPPNINHITVQLVHKSESVHASYLFDDYGRGVLRELCLELSSTKPTNLYSGWQDFGICLGLSKKLLDCIRYNFQIQDPTYYTLVAFAQGKNSTLNKIIEALDNIKRHDVILKIEHGILQMCTNILSTENDTFKINFRNIPFILQDVTANQLENIKLQIECKPIKEHEQRAYVPLLQAQCVPRTQSVYSKTVFLTFASDAAKIAENVIEQLRRSRNNQRIGVLVLREHLNKLYTNPEQFIYDSCLQVNYIMPIITKKYLEDITFKNNYENSALTDVDNKYVHYVYSLMVNYYIKNGCRNSKVRCLIPDDNLKSVVNHCKMVQPIFQTWVKVSDMDKFIEYLLDQ